MNDVTTMLEPDADTDPAAAFDGISRKLAGLTAAIEGMAKRQQELHARDYRPELTRHAEELSRMTDKVTILVRSPALELTPEKVGASIDSAVKRGREADSQALSQARQELATAARTLQQTTYALSDARRWSRWLAGAAGAALLVGCMLGDVVPEMIDSAVPEEWHWPERAAAELMGLDGWTAGQRLLQVSDPRRWRAWSEAAEMLRANQAALRDCQARSAKTQKPVDCTVQIRRGQTG